MNKLTSQKRYLIAGVLGMIGFAGNWFKLPLFFNVDLLFGGIFVMLAFQFLGLGPGLLAAAIAGSATWMIWNHPYALVIVFLEMLVTGLLYRRWRGNLMLADTAYWLFIGMPLVLVFYGLVMKIGPYGTQAIMLKQAINGIANATVARLTVTAIVSHQGLKQMRRYFDDLPTMSERIATLLAFFVVVSSLALLTLVSHRDANRAEQQIVSLLTATRSQTESMLQLTGKQPDLPDLTQKIVYFVEHNRVLPRISYTFYDTHGAVLASNHNIPASLSSDVGELQDLGSQVYRRVPRMRQNISIMERWKRTVYMTKLHTSVGELAIQTSMTPWLTLMYTNTIQILVATLIIFLLTLMPSVWISRAIFKSLHQLVDVGREIPAKIARGESLSWPDSNIPEISSLTNGLRNMTELLKDSIFDQQHSLRQLTIASKRREQLEELVQLQRAHEQQRISRELHDDIGQILQAIKLNLQVLLSACTQRDCPEQELLAEQIEDLEVAIQKLRSVINSFRQLPDESQDLPESLRTLVEKVCWTRQIASGIDINVENDLLERLSDKVKATLYFVTQEAVVNAIRHSGCSQVQVVLTHDDAHLCLRVRDNGNGHVCSNADGSGIAIMRERSELVKGSLTVIAVEGQGTTIQLEVPYQ